MKEKEIIESLQQNIVIPDIVQKKADYAFHKIKKENGKVARLYSHKRKWKTIWIAAAIAALALGTTVCAAAYMHWSKGLEGELQATEEQKRLLEEGQYTLPIRESESSSNSVTVEGITVTAEQVIVDSRFAWLAFKVEGYDLEEGKEPCFHSMDVTVDSEKEYSSFACYGSFYDGLHPDEYGHPARDDGSLAIDENGNLIAKYIDDNGCMEYIIEINGTGYGKGGLIGEKAHVSLQDLGTVYKTDFTSDVDGVWEFDIELKGSDAVRSIALSEPLGDSGAVVTYAEISPISLYVTYDFPMQKEEIEGVNAIGEAIMSTHFVELPAITGVRLKDGTLLTVIINGGTQGYLGDNKDIYVHSFAFDRILDTEQIDALLYIKSYPEGEYKLTEENLYIVPIE